jgi:hypothetical protein
MIPSVLLAVAAGSASAAPLCVTGATLQTYVALGAGGCMIGDKLFNNFVFNFSGSTSNAGVGVPLVPSDADVSVVTTTGPLDAFGVPSFITLDFIVNQHNTVAAFQGLDLQIQYQASIAAGFNAEITDVSGSATAGVKNDNNSGPPVEAVKDLCKGGSYRIKSGVFPSDQCQVPGVDQNAFDLTAFLTTAGDPAILANMSTLSSAGATGLHLQTVGVFDEVNLFGGGQASGTANEAAIHDILNTFGERDFAAPEPGTYMMAGFSLLALGTLLRRKKRA